LDDASCRFPSLGDDLLLLPETGDNLFSPLSASERRALNRSLSIWQSANGCLKVPGSHLIYPISPRYLSSPSFFLISVISKTKKSHIASDLPKLPPNRSIPPLLIHISNTVLAHLYLQIYFASPTFFFSILGVYAVVLTLGVALTLSSLRVLLLPVSIPTPSQNILFCSRIWDLIGKSYGRSPC
jgi:hypothetical protein